MDYPFRAELTFDLLNGGSSLFDLGEKGALAARRVKQMHHLILDLREGVARLYAHTRQVLSSLTLRRIYLWVSETKNIYVLIN